MDDLERRIDALFAGPPAEFTGARDLLAGELRAGGEAQVAARVTALRRPTKLAAALNRLAREEPRALAAAIDAQSALAEAQGRMLAGQAQAADLQAAAAIEAQALAALSPDPEIVAAVRAAARRDDEREGLRRGRLSHDPEPDFGGGLAFRAPPPPSAAPQKPAPSGAERPAHDELAERRERREKEAQKARTATLAEARGLARAAVDNERSASARLAEARRDQRVAERGVDRAEAKRARLADQLSEAEAAAESARAALAVAVEAERRASEEAQEAARILADAERVLEKLGDSA